LQFISRRKQFVGADDSDMGDPDMVTVDGVTYFKAPDGTLMKLEDYDESNNLIYRWEFSNFLFVLPSTRRFPSGLPKPKRKYAKRKPKVVDPSQPQPPKRKYTKRKKRFCFHVHVCANFNANFDLSASP